MNDWDITDDEYTIEDLRKSDYETLLAVSRFLTNYFGYNWYLNDETVEGTIVITIDFEASEIIVKNSETGIDVTTLLPTPMRAEQIARFIYRNLTQAKKERAESDPIPCMKAVV